MSAFTERQVEVSNLLKGAPQEVIDEVVSMVGDAEGRTAKELASKNSENTETLIRMQLLGESDWRKRASLCALLISRSLE